MAQTNYAATLNGLTKEVYADDIQNLVPDCAIITKRVKFSQAERVGGAYHQPTILTAEQGVTVAASGATAPFALNASVAMAMKDAQVVGSTLYIRGQMSYDMAARASSKGAKSFASSTDVLFDNLTESLAKRLEIMFLYGQTGLGKISSSVVSGNATLTLTAATFAGGIWSGAENASLDAYNGSTKINTNAALVVVSVDVDNKQVVVSGNSTDLAALAATHDLYFRGSYGVEFAGLDKIVTNTGTLFGIDAAAFNLFKGVSHSIGGAISLSGILAGVAKAVNRGLNEDVTCYINPVKWMVLSSTESGLRRYPGDSKKASNGFEELEFHGPNGKISVVPHPFVKEGEAFIVPDKRLKRIGATDITFDIPGMGTMWLHVPDYACYEIRAMADQAIFCSTPARMVKLTGIT